MAIKVGDKVKYVGDGVAFKYGETLTVLEDDGGSYLPLGTSNGKYRQWVSYSDVEADKPTKKQRIKDLETTVKSLENDILALQAEVASLKKAQATPKFVPVTTDNIAVGDVIRVIDAEGVDCAALTNGECYTITHVYFYGDFDVIDDDGDDVVITSCEFHAIEKAVN